MKFVIYTRVSTVAQGESHLGLDAQLAECLRYARDGEVLRVFEEVRSGAHNTKRPLVQEAVALAQCHGAVLLVARLDRLGRSQAFLTELRQRGVEIHSVEHGQMGTMLYGIFAAVAEHERELISRRTIAGLEQAKLNGVQLGRRSFDGAQHLANTARRTASRQHHDTVLRILVDDRSHGISYREIADKLRKYNLKTQTGLAYSEARLRKLHASGTREGP